MSGFIIFPFWKVIHSVGSIFDSFPGRVHASMVFGTALVALVKVLYFLFSFSHYPFKIYKPFLMLQIQVHLQIH
jgi:high-affinity Fe2+/Pb2+ permease